MPTKAISIKEYTNLLVFIVQLVRCTAVTWLMRLPRALNLNENPAQFGIFFSANRLIACPFAELGRCNDG
uniref:Uncharacterized protein n=1 Tax=Candidatus Kentrum sp. FM TaxID=2126340 RepID=A0A450TYR4_9GAMM|nr:MAG: hypothetical protein BECKFM1743A_GA0114220_108051 [Candidatus Kentron sp. FM]VFK22022.1 MAG: hypothetical protein BECKFM1743B_GA0114221_108341 [Candidatus Kentron sp. FM]